MGSHSKTTNRPDNGGHTDQRRPQRQPRPHRSTAATPINREPPTEQRRPHRSTP
ncbi:hypothetical protein PGTUg99_026091 [Puccinia graminis f. sp. tritici]|uniref:Uncharacterized protein n=1 Tax=Puccinia graminis f. sp. tritici TaxID=56615 RepID=A0A5B0SEH6_PUCGR|nr:hypothetical protein PGTUg99_026091 [Puccinia graminis f. sp. tritici]